MYPNAHAAVQQYGQVNLHGNVGYASPHRLVQMLMEGALTRLSMAKGAMERGQVSEKAESITRAMAIIEGLQLALDKQKGGEIAGNLEDLYDYMGRRLLDANIKSDRAALEEVHGLLSEIKNAWDAIGESENRPAPSRFRSVTAPAIG